MKKLIFYTLLVGCVYFSPNFIHGAGVVYFDTTTANCLQYESKINEFDYMDAKGNPLPGYLIFTDKTQQTVEEIDKLTSDVPIHYFKKDGDPHISEMTQAEKDAVDGKNDLDRLIAIGDGYENRVDADFLIVVLMERLATIEGITYDKLRDEIKQAIADKLGLPNL